MDQATLSPPEGYKDGSLLDNALSDALSNHVFGAQHIQQLQVIQRLQQQRAAMLAARAAASASSQQQQTPQQQQPQPQQQQTQQQNVIIDPQQGEICPECTQCSECAAAKLAELEAGGECLRKSINLNDDVGRGGKECNYIASTTPLTQERGKTHLTRLSYLALQQEIKTLS